jgi:hypothetical protein
MLASLSDLSLSDLKEAYLAGYGFQDPPAGSEEEAQLRSDAKAWQTFAALQGRAVDGGRLLAAIRSETKDYAAWLQEAVPDPDVQEEIRALAEEFVEWFHRVYCLPDEADDPAWAESYLEYQFACAAPADEAGKTQTVLVAEQYHRGHLDWYSFDIDAGAQLRDKQGANVRPSTLIVEEPISFLPTAIGFGGMPNLRWWEFEDRKTDFGNIQPSTSELATLMLAEFGLTYGNDWSLIPYDLEVGSLCQVLGVVVTDVFGIRTLIRPAADTSRQERECWGMYYLTTTAGGVDTRLFLPPATPKMLESAPLERVILARDEMANMVWGIEHTIPNPAGGGVDGFEATGDLERYFLSLAGEAEEPQTVETDAKIRYRLGTRVPENWIPFISVHEPGSNRDIRLQRAAMPRLIPGTPAQPVEPRGAVLRPGLDEEPEQPYFIHEEEVPRAGAIVTRTYQRTRWWDGKVYTWLGRRKQTGRGQGSSGLAFDQIEPVERGAD